MMPADHGGRPTGAPIPEDAEQIAEEVLACSMSWERDVRLLGNVRACEISYLCMKHVEVATRLERLRDAAVFADQVLGQQYEDEDSPNRAAVYEAWRQLRDVLDLMRAKPTATADVH